MPAPDSQPLHFDKRYPRSLVEQFWIILHKNFTLYWRLPDYNAVRIFFTCIFGLLIGSIYWRKGNKRCTFPSSPLRATHRGISESAAVDNGLFNGYFMGIRMLRPETV